VSEEIMRSLGRIEGELKGMRSQLSDHGQKLESIDGRLRHVETKTVVTGTVGGGIAGVGMGLLAAKVKTWLGV